MKETKPNLMMTFKIVWFALTATVGMHAYILLTLTKNQEKVEVQGALQTAFTVYPFVMAVCAYVVPRVFAKFQKLEKTAHVLQALFTPFILRLVFCETISIFGFLAAFLSKDFSKFPPYAFAAGLLFLLSYPTKENLCRIAGIKVPNAF